MNSTFFIYLIAHSRVALNPLSKRGPVHKHSYENEFDLQVNEISFSRASMNTKTPEGVEGGYFRNF